MAIVIFQHWDTGRSGRLGQTLRDHGAFEVRNLTWEGAAEKCEKVYGEAIAAGR